MQQQIDSIEVSDSEAAAIAATVDRLRANEPGLTAEALLARMTHKIVRGWSDQIVEKQLSENIRGIEDKLRAMPTPDREAALAEVSKVLAAASPAEAPLEVPAEVKR